MTIGFLKTLITGLRSNTSDYDDIAGLVLKGSNVLIQLHKALIQGKVQNDSEARILLYGTTKSASKLSEVKKRLYSKILKISLIAQAKDGRCSLLHEKFNECLREYYVAKFCTHVTSSALVEVEILERILKTAAKYEFRQISFLVLRDLLRLITNYWTRSHKYELYSQLLASCQRELIGEKIAIEAYNTVLRRYTNGSQASLNKDQYNRIKSTYDPLLRPYEDIQSRQFVRELYIYRVVLAESYGLSLEAADYCIEAINKLNAKPYNTVGAQYPFHIRLLANLIKLGDYDQAKQIMNLPTLRRVAEAEGSRGINIYRFFLFAFCKEYDEAYRIVQASLKSKGLYHHSKSYIQLWHICNAYANFFVHAGYANLTDSEQTKLKKFRVYKFLNEVPVYSKDKQGMNISILVVHILFLLWDNKTLKASDRINSLKSYSKKYLIQDETYRSNCFIKMLIELDKADFHPIRGQRYAEKYHKRLLQVPLAKSRQGIEVEVVPYEHLWEMVLDLCKKISS